MRVCVLWFFCLWGGCGRLLACVLCGYGLVILCLLLGLQALFSVICAVTGFGLELWVVVPVVLCCWLVGFLVCVAVCGLFSVVLSLLGWLYYGYLL